MEESNDSLFDASPERLITRRVMATLKRAQGAQTDRLQSRMAVESYRLKLAHLECPADLGRKSFHSNDLLAETESLAVSPYCQTVHLDRLLDGDATRSGSEFDGAGSQFFG